MPQFVIVGCGGERDPDDPMKWIGSGGNSLNVFELTKVRLLALLCPHPALQMTSLHETKQTGMLLHCDGPVHAGVNPMFVVTRGECVYTVDGSEDHDSVRAWRINVKPQLLVWLHSLHNLACISCFIHMQSNGNLCGRLKGA